MLLLNKRVLAHTNTYAFESRTTSLESDIRGPHFFLCLVDPLHLLDGFAKANNALYGKPLPCPEIYGHLCGNNKNCTTTHTISQGQLLFKGLQWTSNFWIGRCLKLQITVQHNILRCEWLALIRHIQIEKKVEKLKVTCVSGRYHRKHSEIIQLMSLCFCEYAYNISPGFLS